MSADNVCRRFGDVDSSILFHRSSCETKIKKSFQSEKRIETFGK
jgi:hypothetical protein